MKFAQLTVLSEFHDGFLKGFLIDQKTIYVFLSTEAADDFVITARDVVAMVADGFKAGNVIFEVLIKANDEITPADVAETYGLLAESSAEAQTKSLLEKSREHDLKLLEINPSYGGRCLILARSIDLVPRAEWDARRRD